MCHAKRILCAVLAAAMLLSAALLTGCSAPKLMLGGTAETAATIGDTTLSTGEYLAYLYNAYYTLYFGQGLYQYASYGYDVWSQTYPYGEDDDAEELKLADYIKRTAQDAAVRQVAVEKLMEKYGVSRNEEDEAELDESLKTLTDNAYLALGISNEHFVDVYKKLNLNESGLFYGLYGEGGQREVSEADRQAYFDENYLSYKIISISLTDSNGSELDEDGKKEITDRLDGYLAQYNQSRNFEQVMDQYTADNKTEDEESSEETEGSTDADNRRNIDASGATDTQLIEAIRSVDVGTAKVVTYKAGGSTPTAALILRLDIHEPATLFTDETENILYGMKYDELDKEIQETVSGLTYKFKSSVVRKCDPQNFTTAG